MKLEYFLMICPKKMKFHIRQLRRVKKERQFNRLVDVYQKILATDGVYELYRGFNISCVGIIVYRGLYFRIYDSLQPVLVTRKLQKIYDEVVELRKDEIKMVRRLIKNGAPHRDFNPYPAMMSHIILL
ncbi:uncharacterized protein LOC127118928 isoform X2 [Lathyrus oleraceus]|uniref:uncharacterized protein LOC127118928 isoform X2 n=1 Tax=Pisum sativum TaxID=3888 RepID=UPI0021D06F87|nr:uncharacterized protein LOC127118928 isoform X2 [Pisum sativum]